MARSGKRRLNFRAKTLQGFRSALTIGLEGAGGEGHYDIEEALPVSAPERENPIGHVDEALDVANRVTAWGESRGTLSGNEVITYTPLGLIDLKVLVECRMPGVGANPGAWPLKLLLLGNFDYSLDREVASHRMMPVQWLTRPRVSKQVAEDVWQGVICVAQWSCQDGTGRSLGFVVGDRIGSSFVVFRT
ncbi:hypothetical protein ETB97_012069 [Aspergillus alliaceus]|uniref:Uncharacterized protein n=1 Tax=Petromyces alliaceus TaxID=209559 RepID=A0A8H6E7B8_PETAA|nr:hypothetical protein ETB97_012069 [Aspergillus burnettii]